jgi:dTDP-4-dehydrorhamnose reductase
MRVAVIGGNGQLGSDVCRIFRQSGHDVVGLTHEHIDIASEHSVQAALGSVDPELIVNTAAMHHVENCESDPMRAFEVNATGARNMARFSARSGARLAHISTDYVFDGRKQTPYVETDLPGPRSVYGTTKLAGEHFVRAIAPCHFVVRVSAIYGTSPCRGKGGMNFVERMLKLASEEAEIKVVGDEIVTPTPTEQIAQQLLVLTQTHDYGLYHATCEGSCSWYDFARAIFECAGVNAKLKMAAPGEFPTKVARPKYSVLENSELNRTGLNTFTDWKSGLESYMATRRVSHAVAAV